MIDQLTDKNLEDYERIEVMKDLLNTSEDNIELQENLKEVLVSIVVDKNDDELVRQHAANELVFYNFEVTEQILNILKDTDEDLDLRINILELIKDKNILKDISEEDELYDYL
ncbi:MAG: hypothetical protein NE330_09435 [Lentisphaeraceae bacterium]|nr:hypothetical protein [Lentisphaeraceae bacterium]